MIGRITFFGFCLLLSSNSFGQKIDYAHEDISFSQVTELPISKWHPIEHGNKLYQGLLNGTYWFRISHINIPNPFISIPEAHIKEAIVYDMYGKKVQNIPNTRIMSFSLNNVTPNSKFYLKVILEKKAVLSIQIKSLEEYNSDKTIKDSFLGLYYGMVLTVILINLLAFFNQKRRTYLHYVIMLCSITLGLLSADGYINLIFDNESIQKYAEPFFNLCVSLSLPVLANSYMPIQKYIPKMNYIALTLAIITIMFFASYVASDDFQIFAITEITALALVTTYWIGGVLMFKKSLEARIFCIAYFLICFSCYDFYIARSFGFSFIGLTLDQFRIGAIIEMLVFTYAISYQSKLLRIENEKIRNVLIRYSNGQEGKRLLNLTNNSKLVDQYNLSKKEVLILQKISEGKTEKEIASDFSNSIGTTKFHIKNIYTKLEVSSRYEVKRRYFSALHL